MDSNAGAVSHRPDTHMMLGNWSRIEAEAGGDRAIRENRRMRVCLIVITVTVLAGCGSSGGTATSGGAGGSTQGTGTTSSSSATSTITTSTTTSPTPSSTTTSAGAEPCRAAGLALSFLGQQGATGHGELGFVLRNTDSSPCRTFGYPGIQFLDKDGKALPTNSTRTTHDFFGQTHATPLVIQPGGSASFRVGVTHGVNSSQGCTTAAALQVIPPNDTAVMHVSMPGGAFECGTATVSPLEAGNTAYP
jgi:hypothetical protein